jgi:calcineurin-like phosphoesterase family protein
MEKTFVASDPHFEHTNIIRYCDRPFKTVREMNWTIVERWNKTVGKRDKVYFLGDLCLNHENRHYWLRQLNGDITLIRGNHDPAVGTVPYLTINYSGREYLLVHDPGNPNTLPRNWRGGWIVHGHHHNHFPERFPFLNGPAKTFNVSPERTDYYPVSMDTIHRLAQAVDRVNPELFMLNLRSAEMKGGLM